MHFPCPTLHVNNWQNWLHRLMETSSKAVESSWDRQITSVYLTPKIQDLKYRSKHVRCADEKISRTEKLIKLRSPIVMLRTLNLDHQNWQLLEGKSYITSISIIKQKICRKKGGTGSGFGRKIGRDGGIEKKKGGKAGFENPYCGPSLMCLIQWIKHEKRCFIRKPNTESGFKRIVLYNPNSRYTYLKSSAQKLECLPCRSNSISL